jgi:chromate transporter
MSSAEPPRAVPTVHELFWVFARIGLTSFGGGISAWLYREMVEKKGWMGDEEFFDTLALCQALPGVNASNIAVWVGRRLLGLKGAVGAFAGVILVPSLLIVLISLLVGLVAKYPLTEIALAGATAAAVALPFSMAVRMSLRVRRELVPLAVLAGTFLSVGILKWPLIWVVPVGAVISVVSEHRRRRNAG